VPGQSVRYVTPNYRVFAHHVCENVALGIERGKFERQQLILPI
jgi:hypothetical protein